MFLDLPALVFYMGIWNNSLNQWVGNLTASWVYWLLNKPERQFRIEWFHIGGGLGKPIWTDNTIQRNTWSESWLLLTSTYWLTSLLFFKKSSRLMTTDLKAVHHVLFNSYDYPKPFMVKNILSELFGNGAFCCITWGMPWCLYDCSRSCNSWWRWA